MPRLNRRAKFEGSLIIKESAAPRARTKNILSAYVKYDATKGGFVLRGKNGNSLLEGRAFSKTEEINAVLNPAGRHFKCDGGIRLRSFVQN
jgi:hypothetical protein